MNKPFFCIAYSDKLTDVLTDIGSRAFCPIGNIESLHAEDIFRQAEQIDITTYAQNAAKQFEQLSRYIEND